jgi:hypothetical protein
MTEITKTTKILKERLNQSGFQIAGLVGVSFVVVGALLDSKFGTTAALYVAVPYLITALVIFLDPAVDQSMVRAYFRGVGWSFWILIVVSLLLGEGFLCLIFFTPVYLFMAVFAALADAIREGIRRRSGRSLPGYVFPVLVMLAATEGTHDSLSLERSYAVSVSRITHAPAEQLRDNIGKPLELQNTRIDLRPIDPDTTEVSLTVHYERRLDPAWYFGPLQRYGVARMAELLIEEVVIR